MTAPPEAPLLLDYATVQHLLGGVSRDIVKDLRKRREIRSVNIGRRTFFTRESVEQFVRRLAAD